MSLKATKIYFDESPEPDEKYKGLTKFRYHHKDGTPVVMSGGLCSLGYLHLCADGVMIIEALFEVTESGITKEPK